jgi:DNA-binding transcriptional regulator YiaG
MTNIPLSKFIDEVKVNEPEIYAAAMEVKKEILLPMDLKSLRKRLGVTQSELAITMEVEQTSQ